VGKLEDTGVLSIQIDGDSVDFWGGQLRAGWYADDHLGYANDISEAARTRHPEGDPQK